MNKYKPPFSLSQYWKPWKKNDISHYPDYPNTTAHMPKPLAPNDWSSITSTHNTLCVGPGLPNWEASMLQVPGVSLRIKGAPNWFHRQMQYYILGIEWKKL